MPVPQDISKSVQKYGLSYIRPYHKEIARRLVLGQTQTEICNYLGMCPSRMSIIVNSPLFKIELRRLEQARDNGVADVSRTLQEVSPLALETLERLMYNSKPSVQLQAASTLLDRAGYGALNKVHISGNIQHGLDHSMTDDEIRRLVDERLKRMQESIEHKDAEIIEVMATEMIYDEVDSPTLDITSEDNTTVQNLNDSNNGDNIADYNK